MAYRLQRKLKETSALQLITEPSIVFSLRRTISNEKNAHLRITEYGTTSLMLRHFATIILPECITQQDQ